MLASLKHWTLSAAILAFAPASLVAQQYTTLVQKAAISPEPSQVGQSYTVTFEVWYILGGGSESPVPRGYGTVTVSDGSTSCSATLTYPASCTLTGKTSGGKTITISYSGYLVNNSGYLPNHVVLAHVVQGTDPATTTTTIGPINPEPSGLGLPYAIPVTVTSNSGTPTGSVILANDWTGCTVTLSGGSGSCVLSSIAVGPVTITATYGGDVTHRPSSTNRSHTVNVKPTTTSAGFVSAASYKGGANSTGLVTPGGLYSIYGSNLGPSSFAVNGPYDDASGKLPTTLAGVTVTFDGVPAPMFLSSANQLNLQVPFEVAGKSATQVLINFLGIASTPITVPVESEQPAFFTITPLGSDSIAINQGNTLNTADNPARRGSTVTIYGTGVGQLSYPVQTGVSAPIQPPGYTGNYTCTIGALQASSAFAGWTPTAVGLAQFNISIPASAPTGKTPVICTSPAGSNTQQGTLYIQ